MQNAELDELLPVTPQAQALRLALISGYELTKNVRNALERLIPGLSVADTQVLPDFDSYVLQFQNNLTDQYMALKALLRSNETLLQLAWTVTMFKEIIEEVELFGRLLGLRMAIRCPSWQSAFPWKCHSIMLGRPDSIESEQLKEELSEFTNGFFLFDHVEADNAAGYVIALGQLILHEQIQS